MKKLIRLTSLIMTLILFVPVVLNVSVYACNMDGIMENAAAEEILTGGKIEEFIIEVENEEETFSYPKNPNYRYTFIWSEPSNTRAVCYMCHYSTMSTVTRKSQYGCDYKQCPLAFGAGLANDIFNTWDHYRWEKCTHCGYESDEWFDRRSYTAICSNDDPFYSPEWVVVEDYDPEQHNVHQNLNWWLYHIQ